jgi:DNA-binding CsgD family transcriptional regulator
MPTDGRRSRARNADDSIRHGRLTRWLGLTPMEGRVAESVVDGLTYTEIAGRFGISYHTVHTHIKAIHRKAGVRTNARLVALIARLERDRP